MNGTLVFGLICTALGSWLVSRVFPARAHRLALLRRHVKTKGKVVRLEDVTPDEGILTWSPVVKYTGSDHREHEYRLPNVFEWDRHRVGSRITVYHERGNPENASHELILWDVNIACVLSFLPLLLGVAALYTVYQNFNAPVVPPAEGEAAPR